MGAGWCFKHHYLKGQSFNVCDLSVWGNQHTDCLVAPPQQPSHRFPWRSHSCMHFTTSPGGFDHQPLWLAKVPISLNWPLLWMPIEDSRNSCHVSRPSGLRISLRFHWLTQNISYSPPVENGQLNSEALAGGLTFCKSKLAFWPLSSQTGNILATFRQYIKSQLLDVEEYHASETASLHLPLFSSHSSKLNWPSVDYKQCDKEAV